jgi:hypothetical protein
MKRRIFIAISTAAMVGVLGHTSLTLAAEPAQGHRSEIVGERELNPNAAWLRESKWGVFTHYLAHTASTQVSEEMNGDIWNKRVNSFQVRKLGEQLSELGVPYFFITIGQGGGYFCAPNKTHEKYFGSSDGRLSQRDLIADLAADLVPRGIRMCVYLPAYGRKESVEVQRQWQEIITEWSQRWGKSISAWWIDGGVFKDSTTYASYTRAFKSGNPDALVAYNTGPIGWSREPKQPATNYEDYLAGEVNWRLPVSGVRPWDQKEYYMGPNISGDQLHFLTFLGTFWGLGEPRFPDELVVGWTKHTNNHGGTISWDIPLNNVGIIPESHFRQLQVLKEAMR